MPGSKGAPLLDEECELIHDCIPSIRHFLPQEHRETIDRDGPCTGEPGAYTTAVVRNRACVFVYYDQLTAKCAFERGYLEGLIHWRKPLSCHLFPVRVRRQSVEELAVEQIEECRPALQRGRELGVPLGDFLREALIRAYGSEWYEEFQRVCRSHRATHAGAPASPRTI